MVDVITPSGNNSAALQSASDTGARVILLETGKTYNIDGPVRPTINNQWWVGNGTVFDVVETLTGSEQSDCFFWNGRSGVRVRGIEWRCQPGKLHGVVHYAPGPPGTAQFASTINPGTGQRISRYPGVMPFMHFSGCNDIEIEDVITKGSETAAILINGGSDFALRRVKMDSDRNRLFPNSTLAFGGTHTTPLIGLKVIDCHSSGSGIQGASSYSLFHGNRVRDWRMGAAINQAGVGGWNLGNIYSNNIVEWGPSEPDLDNLVPSAFEMFDSEGVIEGNIVRSVPANGFNLFGPIRSVHGNTVTGVGGTAFKLMRGNTVGGFVQADRTAVTNNTTSYCGANLSIDPAVVNSTTSPNNFH